MDRVKYEYKLLTMYSSVSELEALCSTYLNAGWVAQGGIHITEFNLGTRYAQAFVREVPREGDE